MVTTYVGSESGWKEVNPSYEEYYLKDINPELESPLKEGYVFPALLKTGNDYILLSEANLRGDYCGSRLKYNHELNGMAVTFPQKERFLQEVSYYQIMILYHIRHGDWWLSVR
ncbi:MAG: glycoside hydrolase family 97 N-terminal domain-containing protein [Saprospiraceae bacterium]